MLRQIVSSLLPMLPRAAVRRVAMRYVAGESTESAVELARRLQGQGFHTTIDMLGEDTTDPGEAAASASAYVGLMEDIAAAGVDRNISIKLTQLGLRSSAACAFEQQLERVVEAAARLDTFVRIDMEDSSVTELTIDAWQRAKERWPRVGLVLQARLRRTRDDALRLASQGASVRLCKGIYPESPSIAFRDPREINASYLDVAETLLKAGARVAFATHDRSLVEQVEDRVAKGGFHREACEFQALLGVPVRSMLERLRDKGHTVRLYVPYGKDWYAYSVRRCRENPELAMAVARGLLHSDRLET
jgi:proline dehydrogenase